MEIEKGNGLGIENLKNMRNLQVGDGNWELEIRIRKFRIPEFGVGNWKVGHGNLEFDTENSKLEIGNGK